ncbi:UPF0104 family protein [Sesbania bispinosa]|nr:UPF0104 family protein [Sesbania bispinosa]
MCSEGDNQTTQNTFTLPRQIAPTKLNPPRSIEPSCTSNPRPPTKTSYDNQPY